MRLTCLLAVFENCDSFSLSSQLQFQSYKTNTEEKKADKCYTATSHDEARRTANRTRHREQFKRELTNE